MRQGHLIAFLAMIAFSESLHAADSTKVFPTVVITATRVETELDSVNRAVSLLPSAQIGRETGTSVLDVIRMNSLIDVQARGIDGVQGDISMRGANFGQVLVLFDGIRLNDLQTAHHNFDIPIPARGIDRIEIVPGQGSALYGQDAFGGVVNIIPHDFGPNSNRIGITAGEHNLQGVALDATRAFSDNFTATVSGAFKRSDGFRDDMDFRVGEIYARGLWRYDGEHAAKFTVAYADKSFGAYHFYAPLASKEATTTLLTSVSAPFTLGTLTVVPRFYFRQHTDSFILINSDPGYYTNIHKDYTSGAEVTGTMPVAPSYGIVWGVEEANDHMDSHGIGYAGGLGPHTQRRGAVYASLQRRGGELTFDVGLRSDLHSAFAPQFDPTLSVGYAAGPAIRLFASAGRSFRMPSFTELYYKDPYNVGGDTLKPESAISYEAGVRYLVSEDARLSATAFVRDERNKIDFAKFTALDSISHAINIDHSTVRGIELMGSERVVVNADIEMSIRAGFTVMHSTHDLPAEWRPRYASIVPKQQFVGGFDVRLPAAISVGVNTVYRLRTSGEAVTLVDGRISRPFMLGTATELTVAIKGSNLLNHSYEEFPGVPMPLRWLAAEIDVKL